MHPDGASEFTKAVKSQITFYELKDTVYSDELINEPTFVQSVAGYGGNIDDLLEIVEHRRKLKIIPERNMDEKTVTSQSSEPPYLAHREAMESARREIFRAARITDPEIHQAGGVTNVAIRAARQMEDKNMRGKETQARKFIKGLLKVAGVESGVSFSHSELIDEEALTRRIVSYIQAVPDVAAEVVQLEPLFVNAGIAGEVRKAIEERPIGMSGADVEAYAAELARRAANPADTEGGGGDE